MEQNDLSIISISDSDLKNVNAFCKLNNIDDIQKYIQKRRHVKRIRPNIQKSKLY